MKRFYTNLCRKLIPIILFTPVYFSMAQEYPVLKITSDYDTIVADPGQEIEVLAEYYIQDSTLEDVPVKWHTDPGYLGKVDKDGTLKAYHSGTGFLYAKYRGYIDSIPLLVTGPQKSDDDDEIDYPKVKIIPGSVKIESADSVELRAFYINDLGEKLDTFFQWSVSNPDLGMFVYDTVSMFYADMTGTGFITATLGDLADTIRLKVIDPKVRPAVKNSKRLTITPGDTAVHLQAGTTIQYSLEIKNNDEIDPPVEWTVSDEEIATIDQTSGLLTLGSETGLALVKATYGKISAYVELLVVDSTADLEVNTITVRRVLPDGNELPAKKFMEGESYKIGGLPFPLNILNAGMLHFPFGCIHEDITLYMFIPEEYAETDDDSLTVNFSEEIITGVKFHVLPADSDQVVEPYYFDTPVILSMVFKHELLDSLQISPEELDVFFADNTGFITADSTVTVDTIKNKIYASIEHFSTIVVKQMLSTTNIESIKEHSESILQVYPNPFQVNTQISYQLSEAGNVKLSVYDIQGREVNTLFNGYKPKGVHTQNWNGKSSEGKMATPGIYFCRILIDGKVAESAKVILNR